MQGTVSSLKDARLSLLVVSVIVALLIVSIGYINPVKLIAQNPTGPWEWWTLGGGVYRNSSVPLTFRGSFSAPSASRLYSPSDGSYYSINTNPLILDLNSDGSPEIIVVDSAGRLVVLDNTGSTLVSLSSVLFDLNPYSVPAAMDLDGDGIPEIVAGTKDGRVAVIKLDTTTTPWSASIAAESGVIDYMLTTSPLVWDVDDDSTPEIVLSSNSGVYCYNFTGGTLRLEWKYIIWERVYLNSPAYLDRIGNSIVHYIVHVTAVGGVYILNAIDGSLVKHIDLYSDPSLQYLLAIHSPIIADTDGDGTQEIVLDMGIELFDPANGYVRSGVTGYVVIIDPDTWTYTKLQGPFAWFAQPAIAAADTDGDGASEVFVGSVDGYVYKIEYTTQGYTIQQLTTQIDDWPTVTGGPTNAIALAVADINNDGKYEVVAYHTVKSGRPQTYTDYQLTVVDPSTGNILYTASVTPNTVGIGSNLEAKFSWPTLSIGDIDSDGFLEVIATAYNGLVLIDG